MIQKKFEFIVLGYLQKIKKIPCTDYSKKHQSITCMIICFLLQGQQKE